MIDGATSNLETPRLELEPLRVEHANEMVAVLADPSLYTFTGGEPPSLEILDRRYWAQVAGSGDPNEVWLNWIIRHKATGAAIGFVQATVIPDGGPSADIAWVIGVDHQGQGFAVEAARAMAEWLIANGVSELTAHIHPEHAASQAIARAVGMADTGEVDDDDEVIWAASPALPTAEPRASADGAARIADVDPGRHDVRARIVEIQRAAYAVEADLIGFDGIPPLHETADDIGRLGGLAWLGSADGDTLVGVVGWHESAELFDIDRLAIHPDWCRQGRGRRLVQAVLDRAGSTTVTVSTGARNHPAVLLYRALGFRPVERIQIAAGVFTYRLERVAGSD